MLTNPHHHRLLTLVALPLLILHHSASCRSAEPPALGPGASLNGKQVFPPDDLWNKDISKDPVDPNSDALIHRIGKDRPLHPDFGTTWNGVPSGIPYIVVTGQQPKVPILFTEYPDESDPGPYPVPPDAPIEGGPTSDGDRHVLILDRDNWILYELYHASPIGQGKGWRAGSGAIFNLTKPIPRTRGWTSADAAGLPIFPGLVRYDEVVDRKEITHALRFTVRKTRKAFIPPASHFASNSTDPKLPPMGMRVRLKADYDISPFPPPAKVILTALKKHGMILADNGGDWFISGAPDPRWDDQALATLKKVRGKDLEVIRMKSK